MTPKARGGAGVRWAMKKRLLTLLGAMFVLSMASAASAAEGDDYVTSTEDDGYAVKFIDDLLAGDGLGAGGPMLVVRPQGARVTLIRPRTSFVNEMLKSVENI